MTTKPPPAVPGYTLAIALGVILIAAGGLWYWTSRPTDTERRSAELGLLSGDDTTTITGPVVLAIIGAFLVLLGVIRSTKPND